MYAELDQKAKENPDHLNTYRLQADAYLVNSEFPQALSQLDQYYSVIQMTFKF